MIWLAAGVGLCLGGLVGVVILVGLTLPRLHVASSRATIAGAPDAVWETLVDFAEHPSWRPEVHRYERGPDRDGRPLWTEFSKYGELPMLVEVADAPTTLRTRIATDRLPFGGSWTWELSPHGDAATEVRITERGEIGNPIFRFMARWVMGYHSTMDRFLENLGRRFGTEVEPEHPDAA
ncbi:MAG: SRPBCC family protein [Phycisphaerales bacterium]|nr:SRPBCC family protein [Phycisphaerales bacterium]NNM26679.1 SRPBCC family protein [Phycisphaerales bacterium]